MPDGYLEFSTKINTDDLDRSAQSIEEKAKETADTAVTSAEKAAEQAEKAVKKSAENIVKELDKAAQEAEEIKIAPDVEPEKPLVNEAPTPVYIPDPDPEQNVSRVHSSVQELIEYLQSAEVMAAVKKIALIGVGFVSLKKIAQASFRGIKNSISTVFGVGSALSGARKMLGGVRDALSQAFNIRNIAAFGKQAVESAAQINAANSQLEQTFGSMQSSAEAAMKRVAEQSGIVETRLRGVGTSIYAFAKTSGMDSTTALTMMEDALTVAADSAAYYDRSLEETSETLKAFLKGNYANDAALGISCTETTRNAAANKLYGKSFKELSEAQKQLALLEMVKDANRLSGAMGQAAREADGWENVCGNLKETWRQLIGVIGQPFLQAAITSAKRMTEILEVLRVKAEGVVGAVSKLFGLEVNNADQVGASISAAVESQNDLTDAVEATEEAQKGALAGFDKMNILSSSDSSDAGKTASAAAVPLTPEVSEKDVRDSADELTKRFEKILKPIKLAWEDKSPQLIANAKRAVMQVKGLISSIGASIGEVFTNGSGERLIGNWIVLFGDVLGIIGDIADALKNAWDSGGRGTALVQSYSDRWNSLLELLHIFAEDFRAVWNDGTGEKVCGDILEILTSWNDTITNLRTSFGKAWKEAGTGQGIISGVFGIFDSILETVKRITSANAEWAKKLDFQPLLESIKGLLEACEPLTQNIGDGIADFWEDVLLPMAGWTIENAVPAFLDLLSAAIDVLNSAIEVAKPLAEWLWDSFLQPIAKWTGKVIIGALKGLTSALKGFSDWIKKHKILVEDLVIVLGSLAAAFKITSLVTSLTAAISAAGSVTAVLTGAVTALSGAFAFLTSPVTLVALAIGAVIAVTVLLVKHWDEVKQFAVDMWASIEDVLFSFFDFCKGIIDSGVEIFQIGWQSIKDTFSAAGDWFKKVFQAAYDGIAAVFKNIGAWFAKRYEDVKTAFSAVGTWFKEKFQQAYDRITGIFKTIGDWFRQRYDDIKNAFSTAGTWFRDKFTEARDNITGVFSSIGNWFGDRWDDIKNVFGSIGGWFKDRFKAAYDNVVSVWSGVTGFFDRLWSGIADGAKNGVNWVIDKLNGMLRAVERMINHIIDNLNKLSWDAPDWLEDLTGIRSFGFDLSHVNIPEIPRLAQGTVIPANYGNFLAMLGDNRREAEVVSPLSTIEKAVTRAMSRLGGSAPKQVVVNMSLYPNSQYFKREIISIMDENERNKGG